MFRKKHTKAEPITIVSYYPNENLQPRDYIEPELLQRFNAKFTSDVQRFIKNTNLDEYNDTFYDDMIRKIIDEAKAEVYLEYLAHQGLISTDLVNLFRADSQKYDLRLLVVEADIARNGAEIKKLEQMQETL